MDMEGNYDLETRKELLDFLLTYITPNKQRKFDEIIEQRTRHITIVLENIFQPHNASAVLRTCDCFGIQDVHIIENEYKYEVNPDVALGSSKWLNLIKYDKLENNTRPALDALKQKGYKIIATTPHQDDINLQDLPVDSKIALLFGTELEGLSDTALEEADAFMKIPMYGFTESFNISVTAALVMFHLTEKLRNSDIGWKLTEEERIDVKLDWARKAINRSEVFERQFMKQFRKR